LIYFLFSQELLGPDKAATLQTFWNERERERTIVFNQARDPEFKSYVSHFLVSSGEETSADIEGRKQDCPNVRCLDAAPIHNCKTRSMSFIMSLTQRAYLHTSLVRQQQPKRNITDYED
jgi:hypothetical protein